MARTAGIFAVGVGLVLSACGGTARTISEGSPSEPSGGVSQGAVARDRSHYQNVIEMIRGKAPGLYILENQDGTVQVRVRGMNQSLQDSGQEPLVVVDGLASSRPAGVTLLSLEPQNVLSIEVLRDLASTAVYGTRGANGVILVRTVRR